MKNFFFALLFMNGISLFAQNEKSATPIPPQNSKLNTQNSTRAVVIGISDYDDPAIPDLRFADRDAEAFANFLRSPGGGGLDNDHLKVLTNDQATAGRIAEALDALIEQTKEGDQVIIYFSGHGDVERKTVSQPGFLLAWDAPSRVYMGGGTYSLSFLQEVVSTLSTQNLAKVTVITDACHAGKLSGRQIGGTQLTSVNLSKQYANEVKILSCQPNEFSLEGEQWGGGRGVFSYHLVDGLFGLADRNGDGTITVGEIDRYLEDKVTAETAPQSQVPMLLGNKTERLATVDAAVLAALKTNKASGLPVFAATESRGLEEEILAKVDTSIREMYRAFQLAVREKRFFDLSENVGENVGEVRNLADVTNATADALYTQLIAVEALAPLRGIMTRNYAAALQDDAQQVMNRWLKADVRELQSIGKSLKLKPIPGQLERAAALLGERHYMYKSLKSRQYLFEGKVLNETNKENTDEHLARHCLSLYAKSLEYEPNSPQAYYLMSLTYCYNLRQPDSAYSCVQEANRLAPSWVLPYTDFAFFLIQPLEQLERAKAVLDKAMTIDSIHGYVWNGWGAWNLFQGKNQEALNCFKKYEELGGATYAGWFNDLGLVLNELGKYPEAENAMKKDISLDSTVATTWSNLGYLYHSMRRYEEAEYFYKKAISVDSNHIFTWYLLGWLYTDIHRYSEAETLCKKTISADSTFYRAWNMLGVVYLRIGRYEEAEAALTKSITLNAANANPHKHLGIVCFKTNRSREAGQNFLKALELNPNYAGAMLGMAYLLFSEGKPTEALSYVEQAIGKGSTFEQLESDEDLAPLRALPEWKVLMKKYFPDKVKD
ncbi:MAG: tetratricopeptide repeat protein [Lewinellaceae bacterium]|nr:tetratricopeptide repeat protein [Lewinellaceae bacterium]